MNVQYIDVPLKKDIILKALPDGNVASNVPLRIVCHSPTGWQWGYPGSGPSDLALNIVQAVLIEIGYKGDRMKDPPCFTEAWMLHHDFKFEWIAPLKMGQDAQLDYAAVEAWVKARLQDQIEEDV